MRIILLLILLLFVTPALAQSPSHTPQEDLKPIAQGDFDALKHTGSGRIDKIIDNETILLQDGKIIRLLGLEWPFTPGESAEDMPGTSEQALERLKTLLPSGTEVILYQTRNKNVGRTNRMGHTLAHIVNKKTGEWINADLIKEGYAYALTDSSNPEMAAQLYKAEDAARKNGKPLWSGPFGLLKAESGEVNGDTSFLQALAAGGSFRVVEGTVNRAALSRNDLYLNLGSDRDKDFTVKIGPATRKALSHRGIEPMGLAGKKIRVRGWIRQWNGPFLELETPERLEIVENSEAGQAKP